MAQSSKVINGVEYSQLATKYGQLLKSLKGSTAYMFDALNIVATLNEVEPTRDLIIPFDNVYQQQAGLLSSGNQFFEVVRALNSHVLTRARTNANLPYSNINSWFADQEIDGFNVQFPKEWADMSKLVGQNVDDFIV